MLGLMLITGVIGGLLIHNAEKKRQETAARNALPTSTTTRGRGRIDVLMDRRR